MIKLDSKVPDSDRILDDVLEAGGEDFTIEEEDHEKSLEVFPCLVLY